jgi:hypothetical protein
VANAKRVKSAKARASVAIRLLKTIKPHPYGYGLSRSFDDCFEMGDGDQVIKILLDRARNDDSIIRAMHRHYSHCSHWLEQLA